MKKTTVGAPARMPVAYGYSRVSTAKQVEKGHSLEDQQQEHQSYFALRLQGKALWGGTFADRCARPGRKKGKGLSGKVPFAERPAGGALCERLQPGDHVLFTDLSRGFRSFKDAIAQLEEWLEMGVHVHLIRYGVDTSNGAGKLMLRMLAIVYDFERELAAERTREALKHRQREGKPVNGYAGYGNRLDGAPGHKRRVEDPREREQIALLVKLVDEEDLTFEQVYLRFLKANVRTRRNEPWSRSRIYRAYLHAKRQPPSPAMPSSSPRTDTGN